MDTKKVKSIMLDAIANNPVFVLVLGMCPTIAKSSDITSAFSLGVSTSIVLIFSNIIISALRKVIPDKVRLPAYLIVISTFTTIIQLFVAAKLPDINEAIGSFIPLIVVNCIILGRAEAFASKNSVGYSALDGVSMGIGFLFAITLLGAVRQLLVMIGIKVFSTMAGGFIALGLLMALFNHLLSVVKNSQKQKLLRRAE